MMLKSPNNTSHEPISNNNITHFIALDKSFYLSKYLTDKEHKVFIYLCRRANRESVAYPSMETIAKECNIKSKSTVSKIINKLAKLKMIEIIKLKKPIINKQNRIMNVYIIKHPDEWKVKPEEVENEDYIDSKKFQEIILFEVKKHKMQKELSNCEQTKVLENKGSNADFSQKCERKDINNNLTKEKDFTQNCETVKTDKIKTDKIPVKSKSSSCGSLSNVVGNRKIKVKAQDTQVFEQNTNINKDKTNPPPSFTERFKLKEQSDFEKKPSAKTRYKLYAYRQLYKEYLDLNWERLSKDEVLFFLINTESLIDNGNISFDKVIKEIWRADKDKWIKNPVGWLIERFSIGNGRFYFLLSKGGRFKVDENKKANNNKNNENNENKKVNYVNINKELIIAMKRYSIPEDKIFSVLSNKDIQDEFVVNFKIERAIINYLWEFVLSKEEKSEMIQQAKSEMKRFLVKPANTKEELRSLLFGIIKERYITLTIEEKIKWRQKGLVADNENIYIRGTIKKS